MCLKNLGFAVPETVDPYFSRPSQGQDWRNSTSPCFFRRGDQDGLWLVGTVVFTLRSSGIAIAKP